MDKAITRTRLALGAAAVFCMVVVPIAAAGGAGGSGDPKASASASVKKQVKKLKKKVKNLQAQVEEVSKQPGPQGPEGEKGEKGDNGDPGEPGLSTGPAGGDLTGNYPDPSIAGGAVTNPKLANNAVNSAKVANNSLSGTDINEGTLDLDLEVVSANSGSNSTAVKGPGVNCPPGKLPISAGAEIAGGSSGSESNVALRSVTPFTDLSLVTAIAMETNGGTTEDWSVTVRAVCARLAG